MQTEMGPLLVTASFKASSSPLGIEVYPVTLATALEESYLHVPF